jgi:hypothetical protein
MPKIIASSESQIKQSEQVAFPWHHTQREVSLA